MRRYGHLRRWIAAAVLLSSQRLTVRAQAIDGLHPLPSRESAKRLIAEHAYPEAEAQLTSLLLAFPQDHELTILQALNYFHERKYTESRRLVTRLINESAATAEVRVLSGLLYVVGNDLGAAEAEFRLAAKADDSNAAAHYYLGRTLYMRQAIDDSIVQFERALVLDPNFIQAYDALGLACFVKQDLDAAQTWFVRGMEQEKSLGLPRMDWLRLDLATMLLTYHRAPEAAPYLAEAERINAGNPQVYLEQGQMYFQERRYVEALSSYGKVLKLDPVNAEAHYFRGRAYHLLGLEDQAKGEFARFVEFNQQHTIDQASHPANRDPRQTR